MSAAQVMVFLPQDVDRDAVLTSLVTQLDLKIDNLPKDFPCDFSAQRKDNGRYLLVEHDSHISDFVEELTGWKRPSSEHKRILSSCVAAVTLHYRGIELAKRSLIIIREISGDASNRCIVENGLGCLLILAEIVERISKEPMWTWERERFP